MSSTLSTPAASAPVPTCGALGNTSESCGSADYSPAIEAFLTTLYSVIGILAFTLNGTVCYLFVKGKVKSSPFNLSLLILSISDMTSIVFITPYVYLDLRKLTSASQRTLDYLCGITIGVTPYWICTFVSIFILCFISVNRFFSINHSTRALWLRKKRTIWASLLSFWVISSCVWTPNLFAFRYDKATGICYRNWPKGFNAVAYTFSTTIIGMIIPISLMLYTFIATVKTLWGKSALGGTDSAVLKSRRHVVSLLGILMLAYFLCSLPSAVYWIMSLATNYFPEGPKGEYLRIKVIKLVVLSAVSNTIMDPVIYALRSHEFKQAFKGLIFPKGWRDNSDILMPNSSTSLSVKDTLFRTGPNTLVQGRKYSTKL